MLGTASADQLYCEPEAVGESGRSAVADCHPAPERMPGRQVPSGASGGRSGSAPTGDKASCPGRLWPYSVTSSWRVSCWSHHLTTWSAFPHPLLMKQFFILQRYHLLQGAFPAPPQGELLFPPLPGEVNECSLWFLDPGGQHGAQCCYRV